MDANAQFWIDSVEKLVTLGLAIFAILKTRTGEVDNKFTKLSNDMKEEFGKIRHEIKEGDDKFVQHQIDNTREITTLIGQFAAIDKSLDHVLEKLDD